MVSALFQDDPLRELYDAERLEAASRLPPVPAGHLVEAAAEAEAERKPDAVMHVREPGAPHGCCPAWTESRSEHEAVIVVRHEIGKGKAVWIEDECSAQYFVVDEVFTTGGRARAVLHAAHLDRRRLVRRPEQCNVRIDWRLENASGRLTCQAIDVSSSGMRLVATDEIPTGARVTAVFLDRRKSGEVRWLRAAGAGWMIGLRFDSDRPAPKVAQQARLQIPDWLAGVDDPA